ncbi:hypothetical protein CSC75_02870 [Pseudoxanthomonas wuyuanensis]|nr:hypothetical protein CSC75_02870 [Pseudoxanthomonas wuyuanensis]
MAGHGVKDVHIGPQQERRPRTMLPFWPEGMPQERHAVAAACERAFNRLPRLPRQCRCARQDTRERRGRVDLACVVMDSRIHPL